MAGDGLGLEHCNTTYLASLERGKQPLKRPIDGGIGASPLFDAESRSYFTSG